MQDHRVTHKEVLVHQVVAQAGPGPLGAGRQETWVNLGLDQVDKDRPSGPDLTAAGVEDS